LVGFFTVSREKLGSTERNSMNDMMTLRDDEDDSNHSDDDDDEHNENEENTGRDEADD